MRYECRNRMVRALCSDRAQGRSHSQNCHYRQLRHLRPCRSSATKCRKPKPEGHGPVFFGIEGGAHDTGKSPCSSRFVLRQKLDSAKTRLLSAEVACQPRQYMRQISSAAARKPAPLQNSIEAYMAASDSDQNLLPHWYLR